MLTVDGNEDRAAGMKQRKLYDLMPGSRGGETVRDRYGVEYMRQIGRKGGLTTVARYGSPYMQRIGKNGARKRRAKLEASPRTVKYWDNTIRRIVPYKRTKRTKKQQYVHILLFPMDVEI